MVNVDVVQKSRIKFISYSDVINWSVRYLVLNNFDYNNKYNLFNIEDFLQRNINTIIIKDPVLYTRVTVKLYNKGVQKRDYVKGKDIGTKKQYLIKTGQFIISKIDARNGAFGIVPYNLDGAITTADFLSYNIDINKINPHFLQLLTSTKQFLLYCQNASSGTTGRQRINEKTFLNAKIPLPSLKIQNRIVDSYNERIIFAEKEEKKSKQIEYDIEKYLIDALGIEKENNVKNKQFRTIQFKSIIQWDVWNKPNTVKKFKYKTMKFENCLYPIKSKISKVQKKDFKKSGKSPIISQEKELISGCLDKKK